RKDNHQIAKIITFHEGETELTMRPAVGASEKWEQQALIQRSLGMMENARKLDANAVLSAYGRHEEYVHIEDGREIPWAQFSEGIRQYLETVKQNDIRWIGEPKVLIIGRDAAVVYGAHRFNDPTGQHSHSGEWSGVFQKIDGQWMLVHSHSSDTPNSN